MALSKQERQQLFVQQRTAELTAAGKPVDTAALTARFNELAATPEGRKQITSKVQLANAPTAPSEPTAPSAPTAPTQPAVTSEGATVTNTYYEGTGADRMQITEFDNGYIKRVSAPEKNFSPQSL